MSRTEILIKLKEVFAMINDENPDDIDLTEDSSLEDLGLHSIGILYLVIGIEELFGVRFENVGVADFATIGKVVDYLESQLQN